MGILTTIVIGGLIIAIFGKHWDKILPLIKGIKNKKSTQGNPIELNKKSIEETRQKAIQQLLKKREEIEKQIQKPKDKLEEIDNQIYILKGEKE